MHSQLTEFTHGKGEVRDAVLEANTETSDRLGNEDVDIARVVDHHEPGQANSCQPNTSLEKRLVRKLDMMLLPLLWWMQILAHIDRNNVANANAAGLSKDLDLSDSDYSLLVSIFFIGYTIFEVPSNLIMSRSRPSIYLCTVMVVWGTCVAAMSAAKSRTHFLVGRFFLGCIEAGVFPGLLYWLTCWYTKTELGKRFALFYTSGTLSPAFGGLLAGAIISGLDGRMGMPGWRWLFLIEGTATVFFALLFVFLLIDYPHTTTKFLSPEECRLADARIRQDRSIDRKLQTGRLSPLQAVKAVLADVKTYCFLILYLLDSTATTISYFIPVTLRTMGYSEVSAQYMTIPIYLTGTVAMIALSTSSDRFCDRRWHITGCMSVGAVCSIVCLTTTEGNTRYAMLCLYVGSLYSAVAQILNWTAESMVWPDQKRSVALAFVNSWGNISIFWGSRLWPSAESPAYTTGFGSVAGMSGAAAILAAIIPVVFRYVGDRSRTNAERELELAENAQRGQGGSA